MIVLIKGLYHPTKDKLNAIIKNCEDVNCFDIPIECSKCRISDRFKKFVGIRLEEV